ncbi:MAG: hypothetical protein KF760_26450 [Candidatus Eremiobacteraeota bacterium]|nr:hypothetical protein [Candidatus Eremiobacteraeota bacterium]MCW5869536.1 hypothetical protein [Candidatus Eremiobacteraeota bacterium]
MTYTLGLNPAQTLSPGSLGGLSIPSLFSGDPALARLGGTGLESLMAPTASSFDPALAQSDMMLEAMMMLLTKLMANGSSTSTGNSGTSSSSSDNGSASMISGGSGASSASSSGGTETAGASGGGAAASVAMAQKFVGDSSISVKGRLDNFSAAGGTGNNCADFVSAILANTQGFKKKPGDASVATFKQDLLAQGWKKVDKAQSKAGDVVIFNGSQHTELVTKDGGKEAIGSNGGATNQQIKTDSLSWGTQEYFHKG